MIDRIRPLFTTLSTEDSAAPLAGFGIFFGFMMLVSVVRFAAYGWINTVYIEPDFHFTYFGFAWVKPFGEIGMYLVFIAMALAAICIMLGFLYRLSTVAFFLLFTYVELLDKTTYLNHYYFVSLVAFILIWLPANRAWSIDAWRSPKRFQATVPRWTIRILQLQLAIVYVYAGIAKINPDWMLEAMPLRMWLPAHSDLPLIGSYFTKTWVAYLFSWFGMVYDLTIPFFLLYRPTRLWAYAAVVVFHVLTWVLFPIGMFPFIMIGATLIFFSPQWHMRWLNRLWPAIWKPEPSIQPTTRFRMPTLGLYGIGLFLVFQLLFPFRYLAYPGELFWTEEGYRFSWRVMLIEKAGYVTFKVKDPATGREGEVWPSDYLTKFQEKQMSTQPDMILEFAHFIAAEYQELGIESPEVRAEAYVTLNGHRSRLLIDPEVDLVKEKDSFAPKTWILPFEKSNAFANSQ
ncbi:MAG: HTTM domain-containing protein [Salibacteraceae bacterium]